MPSEASQVIGLRTWIFSICISSSFRAASTVIISFSRTTTSSVIGLTMLTRLTRPRIDWTRLDLDLLALVDDPLGDPLEVPQSSIVMTTFWATSASLRVR